MRLPTSHLLWKYYWENDVERFRRLLSLGGSSSSAASRSPAVSAGTAGSLGASPGGLGKPRRALAHTSAHVKAKDGSSGLGRNEVNSRDHVGLTVLLRAASSVDPTACEFVLALLEHPSIDIYAQDHESSWNALHRSLYFGNLSIARLLLAKERSDLTNRTLHLVDRVGQLIKTKDHEGNSPFDVYNSTIAPRPFIKAHESRRSNSASDGSDTEDEATQVFVYPFSSHGLFFPLSHLTNCSSTDVSRGIQQSIQGGELYVFGSNRNLSLGVGDEDNRQFPERILLQRPDELLYRFYEAHLDDQGLESPPSLPDLGSVPILLRNRPLVIQDVFMSKLHSALLTTDLLSNLYVCGVGRGGRLGLGDENTQFRFVPILGPFADRKVQQVALGQNHSMAVAGNGELWTWGLNSDSQLGYVLPPPARSDEEPMSVMPRQVFGTLKKEVVLGVAASAIHSVAHTGSSLFCWGRNVGQLALMDADSRSLRVQQTPRKVAASLLSAPIQMVSAIDTATVCLLFNSIVLVFTNYGYNLVKFPVPDVFANHNLVASSFLGRHDPGWKDIRYVTSAGDTIAAVSARGDLFIQTVSATDSVQPAGSTTNPVKIKGAVTPPRCIWQSGKDGVASVSVGEHGSVILCTESGAVWKRVERAKCKAAGFHTPQDFKKDFKFERVPYITGCVNVRSSAFGAFAAVRRDKSVMTQGIGIAKQSLWEDMGSLLCLGALAASESTSEAASRKSGKEAVTREKSGSLSHDILRSSNIDHELSQYLQANAWRHADMDTEVRTTMSPEVRIPVHGWILAGRSRILREAFSASGRGEASTTHLDGFLVEFVDGRRLLTFTGIDVLTVLHLVLYAYQDVTITAWRSIRHAPSDASRFRQVRSELIKTATKLQMPKLEAAARLQTTVEPSLDTDMKDAVSDPSFFEDGDVTVHLEGADVTLHSQLICQRCPFFKGMFQGRSQGQWLSQRRSDSSAFDQVKVDLRHIKPDTFQYVMQHLYADTGEEMFGDVAVQTIDDFSELVLDVMSAANELMLDRLSQICQAVIVRFVTTRNIAALFNEIGPCSVTDFKDAGLEYICLQLECMLENHLLDNLDPDLLQDLDHVVRDNQNSRFPFARGGGADVSLHEKYPELLTDINDERRRRVSEMAFRVVQRDDERKLSSSQKMRVGSLDEGLVASPTPERCRSTSKHGLNEQPSPTLRPKGSQGNLIFNLDEEDYSGIESPSSPRMGLTEPHQDVDVGSSSRLPEAWRGKGKADTDWGQPSSSSPGPPDLSIQGGEDIGTNSAALHTLVRKARGPWASAVLPTAKLDLKDIISEASSQSALTAGLAARTRGSAASSKPGMKMSQKERKRQLQIQAGDMVQTEKAQTGAWETAPVAGRSSPWKAPAPASKTLVKDALAPGTSVEEAMAHAKAKPLVACEVEPHLPQRRTSSPDTRFPGQLRVGGSAAAASKSGAQAQNRPLVPHSRSYMKPAPKAEPSLGASMVDIIGQQKREQELVREAVAKRSLQEIQQEQAFQEWWDQESRRAQEEEADRLAKQDKGSGGNDRQDGKGKAGRARGRGRGSGRGKGRGEAPGGRANGEQGPGKGKSSKA